MRRIIDWGEGEISGLDTGWGLVRIVAELDEEGFVGRELGYDSDGNLVHRYPGQPTRAKYGVFDLVKFDASVDTEMEPEEFDRLWSA